MIAKRLFEKQDLKYKDFSARLIPNIDQEKVIGVRAPVLKKMAKELLHTSEGSAFMNSLPHHYHEENVLHGYMINEIRDYDICMTELKKLLPHIDNWAACDIIAPVVFKKHPDSLMPEIKNWIKSDLTYTVRFAGLMLMRFYLDDKFSTEYLDMMAELRSDEYYINMMTAWYFATAMAKQYDATIKYIEEHHLDIWTHNKAIQKAIESRRVADEHKAYLKTLKIVVRDSDKAAK